MRYLTHDDKLYCAHGGLINVKRGSHSLTASGVKVLFKSEIENASISCPLGTSPCSTVAAIIPAGPKNVAIDGDFPIWESTIVISATGVKSILVPSPTSSQLQLGVSRSASKQQDQEAASEQECKPLSGWIALKLRIEGVDLAGGAYTLKLFGLGKVIKGTLEGDGRMNCEIPMVADRRGILEIVTKDGYQLVQCIDLSNAPPQPQQLLSNLGYASIPQDLGLDTFVEFHLADDIEGWLPEGDRSQLAKLFPGEPGHEVA